MYFTIPRLIFTILFFYFLYCTWFLIDDQLPFPKKLFHDLFKWHEPENDGYFLKRSDLMKARCKHCGRFIQRHKDGVIWKSESSQIKKYFNLK